MKTTPTTASSLIAELNSIVARATDEGRTGERARIEAVFLSCKHSHAMPMFQHLVECGASEQQANDRIQNALAMQSDALDIRSTISHNADGRSKKTLNAAEIYKRRQAQDGGQK